MTDWGSIVLFVVKNGCLYVISLRFLIKIHKFVDNSSIWQHVGYMRNKSINKRENVMNRLLTTSFVLAVAAGMFYTAYATDDNKVLVGKIQTANPAKDSKALRLEYRPAPFPSSMPRTTSMGKRTSRAKGLAQRSQMPWMVVVSSPDIIRTPAVLRTVPWARTGSDTG